MDTLTGARTETGHGIFAHNLTHDGRGSSCWLADAGFTAAVTWQWKDIVVMSCDPR